MRARAALLAALLVVLPGCGTAALWSGEHVEAQLRAGDPRGRGKVKEVRAWRVDHGWCTELLTEDGSRTLAAWDEAGEGGETLDRLPPGATEVEAEVTKRRRGGQAVDLRLGARDRQVELEGVASGEGRSLVGERLLLTPFFLVLDAAFLPVSIPTWVAGLFLRRSPF